MTNLQAAEGGETPPSLWRSEAAVVAVAFLGGLVVWFTLFGLAFTRSSELYHRDAVTPLLLLLGGAVMFGVLRPRLWAWSASALTLPTVLFGAWFFYAVFAQGNGFETEYLLKIGAVASSAFAGAVVGKMLSKVGQREESTADGRVAQQAVAADHPKTGAGWTAVLASNSA